MSVVVAFFVILILTYLLWDYIKNKHRRDLLSKIPSPKSLPIIGHAAYFINKSPEDILKVLTKFTKELGQVWYFSIPGATQIFVSDPKVAETFLASQKLINKAQEYDLLNDWLGEGLLVSGGQKWHQRRKIITPAFHFKILEQFVDVMEKHGQIFVEKLKKNENSGDIDIFPLVSLYAMDVICESAMGYQLNAQMDSESEYVKSVKEITKIIFTRFFDIVLNSKFFYKFSKMYQQEKEAIKIMHNFTNTVINERRKYLQNNNDDMQNAVDEIGGKRKYAFLDLLLQATVDGRPLDDEGIREEVDTFMFEGHDTTTSGISFCLLNIAKHRDVQEKIYQECREVFGDKETSKISDLNQLHYLDKVVKESLRLYPSVPFFARTVPEDVKTNDYIFPAGTTVTFAPIFMGRDESIFDDQPLKFNPMRFEKEQKNPFAYIPFSAGARNCIGQKFAMLEIKSIVSKIVKNFEISVKKENEEPTLISELVLRAKEGIILNLKSRN